MAPPRPYKKDLTPIGRGGITKQVGKGATEQRRSPGGSETLTGGDPFASAMNRYPKPAPPSPAMEQDAAEPAPPVPLGSAPTSMPSALMPPDEG
jgi:hypothetical protein